MTVDSDSKVAVVGLGSMGYGMAQSLLRAGHIFHGFDVVPAAMDRFVAEGGATGDLADIAPGLYAVVVVLLNAEQTETVLFGENGIVPMPPRRSLMPPPRLFSRWATRRVPAR